MRPRLLLVPWLSQLEWRITPLLDGWADVASFDAPGVGGEPASDLPHREAMAERGLAEADRRGWESFTLVADELGVAAAAELASRRPEAVSGLAFGHACLSHRLDADPPAVDAECHARWIEIARTDYRDFARDATEPRPGGTLDTIADLWADRVPREVALRCFAEAVEGPAFGDLLAGLDVPMLFARHEECSLFTAAGFEVAAAAFPQAITIVDDDKPNASDRFALALRDFCRGKTERIAGRARRTRAVELPGGVAGASAPVVLVVAIEGGSELEGAVTGRFADEGYEIMRADSPLAADSVLTELREQSRDVAMVLADDDLGGDRDLGVSGAAMIESARELHPDTKTVLLVRHSEIDAAMSELTEGVLDRSLVKPLRDHAVQLFPIVADLLGDWRRKAEGKGAGVSIVGDREAAATIGLRTFLHRNDVHHRVLDPRWAPDGRRLAEQLGGEAALPAVVLEDGTAIEAASPRDLAEALEIPTRPKLSAYDLAIVGGGPAGLAAAVYGASEGLATLLLERFAPGGQAGQSSRIENYLGFPAGLSGSDLTMRALQQAKRLKAELVRPREVVAIETGEGRRTVGLAEGDKIGCRALLISTGVDYRRLEVEGIERLSGRGVNYGAAVTDADELADRRVGIVGGANSAGQAALDIANRCAGVTMLIRADSISKGMSAYLTERIEADPRIEVRTGTQVAGVVGSERLEAVELETGNAAHERLGVDALFIFIGAAPRTDWLPAELLRDERGFLLTGRDVFELGGGESAWPLDRDPYPLETSVPGILAAGDVRHGSIKRVASAVGEGAMAVQLVHQYLAATG